MASGSVLVPTAAAPILDLPTEYTEWISDDGGSAGRELPAISADGRYVVFVGRSEAFAGVWVKDRDNGLAKRVAEGFLFNPDISADGAWVTWAQYGSGVGGQSIWVLNWTNPLAEPELVSLGDDGQSAAAVVDFPSLSDDGRYVAFQSMDDTLDEDVLQGEPGGGPNKVYVRDRDTDDTEMVSVTNENVIVNGNAIKPDISPDGNYVAFASDASVLQGVQEGETTTTYQQVYLRDRAEETTLTVSALPGTAEGELVLGDGISSPIYGPSVSADGTLVAFESDATNLVADDTNGDTDAFVKDMTSGAISRVSVMEDGSEADILADGTTGAPAPEPTMIAMARSGPGGGGSENGGDATDDITPNVGIGPVLSNDGDFVAFESKAALTADDDNGGVATCTQTVGGVSTTVEGYVEPADIYRFDLGEGGELVRESVANPVVDAFEASGYRIDGMSGECTAVNNGVDPAISADGSEVVFVSNGNLTGREVAEEDDHTTLAAATAPVENLAVEPAVYLRRPFVTGDEVDTMSQASVDPYSDEVIEIDYTLLAAETVDEVELFVELPGADEFISAGSDLATDPGGLDGAFTYDTEGVEGVYRFYTVATVGGVDEIPPTSKYVSTIYDITAPETAAIAPSSTTTNTWTVTYEATDDVAGMAKVELFAKALDETTYTKVAEDIGAGIDYKFSYMAGGAAYGSYSFYTIGTDTYSTLVNPDGNIEAAPTTADLVTVYSAPPSPPPGGGVVTDTTAPVSSASAPAVSVTPTWTVTYTATDAGGSGVTKVELFV
ncbi:MAG TPA: hypothetical protein VFR87_20175, partial [Nocardioidaceae bacterium]|nr:hypothetical protein [Nocardioidaceae bacterium]